MMMTDPSQVQRPFVIPIFLPHAGCPHQCVFCHQGVITRGQAALPDPADVADAIQRFAAFRGQRRSTSQIAFYGGNFLGLPPKTLTTLLQVADRHIEAGVADSLRFSTRPDTIDADRLSLLAPFAVDTIELGVQSMDGRVLRRSMRGHSVRDTETAVELLKQRGYKIGIQLMIGLPGQTPDSLERTAHRVARLAPDFVRLYPTLVLKHTVLSRWYESGLYAPLSLSRAVDAAKDLYLIFYRDHVPVVRMGLQASEALASAEMVIAGPYHPAFGHLVHGRLFLQLAQDLLKNTSRRRAPVTLRVHPRSLSKLQGLHRANVDILQTEFSLSRLHIRTDDQLPLDAVALADGCRSYSDLAARRSNPLDANKEGSKARCDCD